MNQSLVNLIESLSPDVQGEVEDFVRFLSARRGSRKGVFLKQDWAAGLKDAGGEYSALELQKKALEWRGD